MYAASHNRSSPAQILLLILLLILLYFALSIAPFEQIEYWGVDFGVYRAAANTLRNNENPYLVNQLLKYRDGAEIDDLLKYSYAPIFLILLIPFTWIPLSTATIIWLMVNIALIAAAIYFQTKIYDLNLKPNLFQNILLAAIFFIPTIHSLTPGQVNSLLLFTLTISLFMIKLEKPYLAGVFLALSFIKLQLLFLIPILLIATRKWKVLGGFIGSLLLFLLPFWEYLPSMIASATSAFALLEESFGYFNQPSLRPTLQALIQQPDIVWISYGVVTAIISLVFYRSAQKAASSFNVFNEYYMLAIVLSLILAGYVRSHDLQLLILPLMWLWSITQRRLLSPKKQTIIRWLIWLAFLFPYILLALSIFIPTFGLSIWHIATTLCVLAALLIAIKSEKLEQVS